MALVFHRLISVVLVLVLLSSSLVEATGFVPSSSSSCSFSSSSFRTTGVTTARSDRTTTPTTTRGAATLAISKEISRLRQQDTTIRTTTATTTTCLKALPSSAAAAAAVFLVRGGAGAILDMGRESFKQQSMAGYSTVTALIMNCSLRLYTSQKFAKNKVTGQPRWIESIFTALTILCIISGIFTAVLFNVLAIYGKEALGLGNLAGYMSFQAVTAVYRQWGFRCFLTTGMSFVSSFLLSVSERTANEDRAGQLVLATSALLVLVGCLHIKTILNLATKFIYTPEFVEEFLPRTVAK